MKWVLIKIHYKVTFHFFSTVIETMSGLFFYFKKKEITPTLWRAWPLSFNGWLNSRKKMRSEYWFCTWIASLQLYRGIHVMQWGRYDFLPRKIEFLPLSFRDPCPRWHFQWFSFCVGNEKFLRLLDNIDPNLHFHLNFKGKSSKTLLQLLRPYLIKTLCKASFRNLNTTFVKLALTFCLFSFELPTVARCIHSFFY